MGVGWGVFAGVGVIAGIGVLVAVGDEVRVGVEVGIGVGMIAGVDVFAGLGDGDDAGVSLSVIPGIGTGVADGVGSAASVGFTEGVSSGDGSMPVDESSTHADIRRAGITYTRTTPTIRGIVFPLFLHMPKYDISEEPIQVGDRGNLNSGGE